jgi:hypothetical protein
MSHTIKATRQFRKELSEAMSISPTRRAQEERQALRQVRDFLLETQDEGVDEPMFPGMGGTFTFSPHSISDGYATE